MTLKEAAAKGITRLIYVRDGKPVWNKYSFGDIAVFDDGTYGPWMKIYDPCGSLACDKAAWTPITVITFPVPGYRSIGPTDQFEAFVPPDDIDRFPGCPPVPNIIIKAPG